MSLLCHGDTIGIIAPSAGLNDKTLQPTIAFFHELGLTVKTAENLNCKYRYMSGTDSERATALNKMFADKDIKALFCLRGGAGSTRILNLLDYNLIKNNHKPIIGLSDSTALQNAVISKSQNPCLTGFLPLYDITDNIINETTKSSLYAALFSDKNEIHSGTCLIEGKAQGNIIGGCLSVLCYLCGTPYFPDLKDKILLLEDVGEKTYKIDLLLNQLKQQKNFNKLKGIIIGQFTKCHIADNEDGSTEDCINDFTQELTIPIIKNFAYGHIPERHIIPLGLPVKLTAEKNTCSISW